MNMSLPMPCKTAFLMAAFCLLVGACSDDNGTGEDGDASEEWPDDWVMDMDVMVEADTPGDMPVEENPCAEGLTECDGECVDTLSDEAHCGGCGSPCNAYALCEEGTCVYRYELYYGELHGHTELSDGVGTVTEYFTYCRDVSLMDFCAVTDHNMTEAELDISVPEADGFNTPTFVAFSGNEWSSGQHGHKVCYNISEPCRSGTTECDTPDELYAAVLAEGGLCHAAHPATVWSGQNPTDWSLSDDSVEIAGEIYADEPKMNEAWLDFGLRIGVVGVSDTHDGVPGSRGVTGCWAFGLTREAILEALASRRCFATRARANAAENPVSLEFRMNDHWMGEVVDVEDGETLEFFVSVSATVEIQNITLIKEGNVHESHDACSGTACEWTTTDVADGPAYYYVTVSMTGNRLWSPPVFLE